MGQRWWQRAAWSLLMISAMSGRLALAEPSSACASIPHADHPKAHLVSGPIDAVIFLPDTAKGYYRGSRFDWSGVVGCLTYSGHKIWGEWFPHYDPLLHDAIAGPVEEFRTEDGAIGYSQAKPGEAFVKVGVGVLRKIDDSPYKFVTTYPLIDPGKWKVKVSGDAVIFQQRLKSSTGISYLYKKTLKVDERSSSLILEHELKNLGSVPIETDVYDHDFFTLDEHPTGPGMVIRFPFHPVVDSSWNSSLSKIEGQEIQYLQELQEKQTVAGYLTGYSEKVSDYDFSVEDQAAKIGVEQTSDQPVARFYFWSIRSTISPEAYIHLNIPPGKVQAWTIRYRFYSLPKN